MAEHAQMRAYSTALSRRLEVPDWFKGAELAEVRILAQSLRRYDKQHRPKGTALFAALRQRGAAIQALLDDLEREGDECTLGLEAAMVLLDHLSRGSAAAESAEACASAFRDHTTLLLRHLDREDIDLRRCAMEELAPEEWSTIVSSISTMLARK